MRAIIVILMLLTPLKVLSAEERPKLELAKELALTPAYQAVIDGLFSPENMAFGIRSGFPPGVTLPQGKLNQLGEALSKAMMELRPKAVNLTIISLANHYSAEELAFLIGLYRQEVVLGIVAKQHLVSIEVLDRLARDSHIIEEQLMPALLEIMKN
ncbi:hypothetical protein GN278_02290 [Rhodobacteraceae bacterium Araon29]